MKRILIIGCGDVALRTIPLLAGSYKIYALVRNPAYVARLRALGVSAILGDLDDRKKLVRIAGIADVVLHFAPPPSGIKNGFSRLPFLPPAGESWIGGKWAEGRSIERDTRTQNLLAALAKRTLPAQLIYISTSGVYGDCGGAQVSETDVLNANSPRALRRVAAEQNIRIWAHRNQVRASILRVPGIYALDRLPLDRLRAGAPAILASEDSYSNHIHADDLARIAVAALRYGKMNRIYHATDDDEMKMGEYFDVIADAYALPRPPRLPRAEVQERVSPMMWSFMNESRRLTNARMKQELKVRLRYPSVRDALP
jgi:nucleoside-diphosphate-sugar epimerase